jgi:hypothetical protein
MGPNGLPLAIRRFVPPGELLPGGTKAPWVVLAEESTNSNY